MTFPDLDTQPASLSADEAPLDQASNRASIVEQLKAQFGAGFVVEAQSRARNYWDSSPLTARALVRPRSTEDVSQIMRLCHASDQNVVVHGGLTGACGGDLTTSDDLALSLERMTEIEEIDVIGRTVTVQAGCSLQTLQAAVEQAGLYFPLDLGARGSCTVGGNVSTNAGGLNVIRYGMMRAHVLGLEVVLPDGTVISSLNHMLKNNTGYDIKQLFIGSEGTLGIVTRMVLALREQPVSVNTALVAVSRGDHIPQLLKLMDKRLGGMLTSFEAMWGDYFRAVTGPGGHVSPMDRTHPFYVVIEAQGPHHEEDADRFHRAMEQALEAGLIADAVLPKSGPERARLWAIRENFEAILQNKPVFLYDISLPLRHMISYVDEVAATLSARWPTASLYVLGHIGDGNLHFFISPGESARATEALHEVSDEIVYTPLSRYQGAVSAEHGIGLEKKAWMPVSRSAAEIELMRLLKRTIDPKGILNRGKVLDAYATAGAPGALSADQPAQRDEGPASRV